MKRALKALGDIAFGMFLLLFFWVTGAMPNRKREPDPHEEGV